MATKSVIQIDVLDESFKKFQQAFDKYQAALKKMPGDWQKVNQASAGGAQTLNKHLEKSLKNLQEFDKKVKDANKDLKETEKSTSNIAQNLANSVVSLARWVTLGSIGGGFGLGALGASASDYRRQAQGLGVSTGGLRAANVNLGRYINPGQVLSNIADIQSDLSRRPILSRLGLGANQNAEQALPSIITNAIRMFNQGGRTKQYAEAMGLTQVFSLEELRRLSSLSQKELQETFKRLKQDRDTLSVDDETSRKWQNFWVQLKRSGNDLETKLIDKLVALAPAFEKVSEGITKFITSLLDSPDVKKWIENLGENIGKFGEYLTSPEFKQDVAEFYNSIKSFGITVMNAVNFIQDLLKTPEQRNAELKAKGKLTPETMNYSMSTRFAQFLYEHGLYASGQKDSPEMARFKQEMAKTSPTGGSIAERFMNPGNLRVPGSATQFQKFSSNEEGLRAMARQLLRYERRDKLDTVEGIVSKYAPSSENNTQAYIKSVLARTGFAPGQHLNLENPAVLSNLMSAMTKQENSRSNFTASDIQRILVQDATGGNVTITTNAMK